MGSDKHCEVVATISIPTYSVTSVGGRYIIIGGGGGAAKTGIKNQIVVYELYHNGEQTTAEKVLSYDVGDSCVSNMVGWANHNTAATESVVAPTIMLALGLDEKCAILRLTPEIANLKECAESKEIAGTVQPKATTVRRRNINEPPETNRSCEPNDKVKQEVNSTLRGNVYFTFSVEQVKYFQSVNRKDSCEDVYQKVCRVSPDLQCVATGGTDGYIRLWALSDMQVMIEIAAHSKEVDDLDFKPDGKQIVSVSKPSRECCIWNTKDGKKYVQIGHESNGIKYKFYKARFAVVEGDINNSRLFTISNALVGTKNPGLVSKWCSRTYSEQKTQQLKGTLSSLALSDDGKYVATGTMDGTIYILISFSLQTLQVVEDAHNVFVTGLEWLPSDCQISKMVRGFSDASVVSVSCDNSVKIVHVPRPGMMPVWAVALLSSVTLFGAFALASYIGL